MGGITGVESSTSFSGVVGWTTTPLEKSQILFKGNVTSRNVVTMDASFRDWRVTHKGAVVSCH